MSVTINGVACEEIVRNLSEGIDERGPHATKGYLCLWGNRFALANGLLGLVHSSGPIGGGVTFSHPAVYPESSNLYCQTVEIEPHGTPFQGSKQIAFPYAIVWANFGIWPYSIVGGDDPGNQQGIDPDTPFVYATQKISFSIEQYNIPASSTQTDDNKPVPKDITGYFPRADMSITLHKVPYMPAQLIFSLVGKINNAVFLGAKTGQVIFQGGDSDRTASTDGTFTQDLTYSFSYRTVAPWNYIVHPNGIGSGTYAPWVPFKDKSGNPYIKSADLTQLFFSGY